MADDLMQSDIEPPGPRAILRLAPEVVNRIAAAEVIQRPSNAIKELIENSLDAESSSIKVTVKDGGLKMFQVVDNGSGIDRESLPLLCTRHATSKISSFSDLSNLSTYGFRGEALASVSYACRLVTVITKRKGDLAGWKAYYLNGELVSASGKTAEQGGDVEPKPAAANDGTMITADDLFYNNPLRRKAFKSAAEEHNRILEVVSRYAVHNPQVGWICKKSGSTVPEVTTPSASEHIANISIIYGSSLSRELLHIQSASHPRIGLQNVEGWTSNANWNQKKMVFLLFINRKSRSKEVVSPDLTRAMTDRLVDSTKIKKAVEGVYTTFLPKGTFPFTYLSLEMDPTKLDVNVHPTKQEVHFLDEDEVVEAVVAEVARTLSAANASRTYSVQTLLPGARDPKQAEQERNRSSTQKSNPQQKVRIHHQDRTLESMRMFAQPNPSQIDEVEGRPAKRQRLAAPQEAHGDDDFVIDVGDSDAETENGAADVQGLPDNALETVDTAAPIKESEVSLRSIRQLREAVKADADSGLAEMLRKHTFVGLVDMEVASALIQHGTALNLVQYETFAFELFYQLGLRQFGALGAIELDEYLSVRELAEIGVEAEREEIEAAGHAPAAVVTHVYDKLLENREMIAEYFNLVISQEGAIERIPMLLPGYTPSMDGLPALVLRLAFEVDYTDEKTCFDGILRELARFYSPANPLAPAETSSASVSPHDPSPDELAHERYQIEHALFPALKRYALPGRSGKSRESVIRLASLPELYRVFERC